MAKVTVEKREFTNDEGRTIPYNVICITGSLNGRTEHIEKSISKVEAMMIGMLLESDEDLTNYARKATAEEGQKIEVKKGKSRKDAFLDELGLED